MAIFAGVLLVLVIVPLALNGYTFILAIAVPIALALAVLGWKVRALRGLVVRLYAAGLAIERRGVREEVLFEDVNEVFLEINRMPTFWGTHAFIHGLRLIEHGGRVCRFPTSVRDPVAVVNWVLRNCSSPLLPEARRALGAGETLTFGDVRLTRETIAFGNREVRWVDLRLVRLQSGSIAFFRRWPVFPWKTVTVDMVPHAIVLIQLIRDQAPRVELDVPPGFEGG